MSPPDATPPAGEKTDQIVLLVDDDPTIRQSSLADHNHISIGPSHQSRLVRWRAMTGHSVGEKNFLPPHRILEQTEFHIRANDHLEGRLTIQMPARVLVHAPEAAITEDQSVIGIKQRKPVGEALHGVAEHIEMSPRRGRRFLVKDDRGVRGAEVNDGSDIPDEALARLEKWPSGNF